MEEEPDHGFWYVYLVLFCNIDGDSVLLHEEGPGVCLKRETGLAVILPNGLSDQAKEFEVLST